MHFHTVNVYYDAVMTVHVPIFLTNKQIMSIQTQNPQLVFTFITSFYVVLIMVELNRKKKICYMYKQETSPDECTKIFTRK